MNRIYEINARPWFLEMKRDNPELTLDTVPLEYWQDLREKGFDMIWLMGVWNNAPTILNGKRVAVKYMDEYLKVLPDATEDDVIDSAYAIDDYELNPLLGEDSHLVKLRDKLHSLGMKLMLDFIPNHFHFYSKNVLKYPDAFLRGREEQCESGEYYKHPLTEEVYAHGKDPYTGAWNDTVQINWHSAEAHAMMREKLLKVASMCDGVRCDMGMLILPEIFGWTWGDAVSYTQNKDTSNWWKKIIDEIKDNKPDFKLIVECYWDTQNKLLESGFDGVYLKKFYDAVCAKDTPKINYILKATPYFGHSVIFLENHDEPRANSRLLENQLMAAAAIQATLPATKLYYDGQLEGKKVRLPVQLARNPIEPERTHLQNYYNKLLTITNDSVLKFGDFTTIDPISIGNGDPSYNNLVAYRRSYKNETFIVIVNMSDYSSQAYIGYVPEVNSNEPEVHFVDEVNDHAYIYSRDFLSEHHLYIALKPWDFHIFRVIDR